MKIGFLVSKSRFGGGEHVLAMLIRKMAEMGMDVRIYTWEEEWLPLASAMKIKVQLLEHPPVGLVGKIKGLRSLTSALLVGKPEWLIVFSLHLAEVAAFSCRLTGVPLVVSERVDPRHFPIGGLHRFLRQVVYLMAGGIVFQTEGNRSLYNRLIQRKGAVIGNPVNTQAPNVLPGRPRTEIVAIGRLSTEKNLPLLIDAFALSRLKGYVLRIYGAGPLEMELKELVSRRGMQTLIRFEGQVNNPAEAIAGADIFVLPSLHEGMPNALMEAMTMGLACIATDVPSGGVRSLITHEEDGVIVPVANVRVMARALQRVAVDRDFNEKIRANARNVAQRYSLDKIVDAWIAFLRGI